MTRPDASESVLDADGPSTNWMKSVDSARPADGQGGNGTALPSRGRPVRTRDGHVDGPSPGRAGHVDGRLLDGLVVLWTATASAGCPRVLDALPITWTGWPAGGRAARPLAVHGATTDGPSPGRPVRPRLVAARQRSGRRGLA
jgi:hypothetical protein